MSALTGKKTLAPGESVGLLALTGASVGTLYGIIAAGNEVGIVSGPDDSDYYELESNKEYVTDAEIYVKNYTDIPQTVNAVAIKRGTGGSGEGNAETGRVYLLPGQSIGLLALAGVDAGGTFTVTGMGSNLHIVESASDSSGFPFQTRREYVTDTEILVKNVGTRSTVVSVLAVPTVIPTGEGGGGGAVDSVNGKTGVVVLSLDDVAKQGDIPGATTTTLIVADSLTAPTAYSNIGPGLLLAGQATGQSATLGALSLTFNNPSSSSTTVIEQAGTSGNRTITLPSTTGTLALLSDIPAAEGIPAGGTTGQVLSKSSNTDGDASWTTISTTSLGAVPTTRTVAGKALSANITLAASDVGAVPTTRTVAGKALSADITLAKADVGLSNVDNTSDANKPISTATQTAINGLVPNTRTVAGKALSSNITLVKADVGLGNVDNTSDANKPISTATQTALNAKVGSANASVTGIEYYASVGQLPSPGTAGVLYVVPSA